MTGDTAFSNLYSTFSGYTWNRLSKSDTAGCGKFKGKERVGVTLTQTVMNCINTWCFPILLATLQ